MRNNLDTKNNNDNISSSKACSDCNNDVKSSNAQNAKSSNVQNINKDKSRNDIENNGDSHSVQEVLKQCKLSRNALILGLLNNKQITTDNLRIPNEPSSKHETFHNQSDLQVSVKHVLTYNRFYFYFTFTLI